MSTTDMRHRQPMRTAASVSGYFDTRMREKQTMRTRIEHESRAKLVMGNLEQRSPNKQQTDEETTTFQVPATESRLHTKWWSPR